MEITLQQILQAREQRAGKQEKLLRQYGKPLICFTMNIPGPQKCSRDICAAFRLGMQMLLSQLEGERVPVLHCSQSIEPTGCEGFVVADAPEQKLKALTVAMEDYDELTRLFDLDVIGTDMRKLSREDLGLGPRKCLLCAQPAALCARSRAHGLENVEKEVHRRLTQGLQQRTAGALGGLAQKALLYEVCASPKPGLVDRYNSGSHGDMDIFTFLDSAVALRSYFEECVRVGMRSREEAPPKTLEMLEFPGKYAYRQMLTATNGVNTHKGAIFTLGILCGAVGRLTQAQRRQPEAVLEETRRITQGLTKNAFAHITEKNAATTGEKLYVRYGITGVRGQAEAGFPAVLYTGLPVLEEGLEKGLSLNDAGCAALLAMLTAAVDTNLIARSDLQTQQQLSREMALLLMKNRYPDRQTLEVLDARFQKEHLSPGGTADLLAITYFLYFLKQLPREGEEKTL